MDIYQVGGSVRDKFLGTPSEDRDWCVVGATPQQMLELGYTQVGADFPVFLHPQSGDEYALARTERKSGSGYLGFEVNTEHVTLEEDLMRRDLTINAMALDANEQLVDPYGGKRDIDNKVLRHVGPAFSEDPLRILRVLRFHARFGPDWSIAPETAQLMTRMVMDGEASHLVPERIWKETSRALMEPHPHLYLQGLWDFGLTTLPCFHEYRFAGYGAAVARQAAADGESLATRCALVFGHTSAANEKCPAGWPGDIWKCVRAWAEFGTNGFVEEPHANAEAAHDFFEKVGLRRDPMVFEALLGCWRVIDVDSRALQAAAQRMLAVDTKAISASMPPGLQVGEAIRSARVAAIANASAIPA